jgi:hypothetical protein
MSGRIGGVRERFHPKFDDRSKRYEVDTGEKMSSRPWNPRLQDETTCFERIRLIVQMVDDEIKDLWWEGG